MLDRESGTTIEDISGKGRLKKPPNRNILITELLTNKIPRPRSGSSQRGFSSKYIDGTNTVPLTTNLDLNVGGP